MSKFPYIFQMFLSLLDETWHMVFWSYNDLKWFSMYDLAATND